METKSIDQYFELVRKLPVVMSFEEVQALVKIKGVTTTQHQSWWKPKNFIFMTTVAIIMTTAIMFFNSSKEEEQVSIITKLIPKENLIHQPVEPIKQKIIVPLNNVDSNGFVLLGKVETNDIHLLEEELPLIQNPTDIETPILNTPLIKPINNKLLIDTSSQNGEIKGHTKTIVDELPATGINLVKIKNSNGDISIITWNKPTIQMKAFVTITGGNEEDIQKGLEDFDLNLIVKGSKIEIENSWSDKRDCNCSATSIKGKITTKKGEKIKVKKYRIDYQVMIPKKMNLDLNNNYGNIVLDDVDGDVKIVSFQGNFSGGNIGGNPDLSEKYGNAKVGDFINGDISLFQGELESGNSKKIDLNAKYSDVTINATNSIDLISFQTDITIKENVDKIKGSIKYGNLELSSNVNTIDLQVFQADIKANEIKSFKMSGSYSFIKANTILELNIGSAMQNSYKIEEVTDLEGTVKYTSFDIGILNGSLDLETFQGSIDVGNISGNFSKLDIDSKYTPIDLNFSADSKFNISAKTSYTDFNYPEKLMQVEYNNVENQKMNFKGVYNSNNTKDPSTVSVICFQGKLNLK